MALRGRLETIIADMTNEPSSLGLGRGVVELRSSDPAWAEAFRSEAARLTKQIAAAELAPLLFEHIGSTAVPGLDAKPIIDLIAGYQQGIEPRAYFSTLQTAGYEYRGPQGVPQREYFVRGPESHRTNHFNLVPFEGKFWRDHLTFRDRLRNEPAVRTAYAALKRQLAAAHPHDRGAYTDGKAQFVLHITQGGVVLPAS
jgi:GrpB-like predicted nucleotidyltransferase (UPF0157 family)